MDSRDDDSLSSSLPSSLIPHLYTGPQDSSARTTLVDNFDRTQLLPPLERLPPRRHYDPFEAPAPRHGLSSSVGLMDLPGAAVHQPAIPLQSVQRLTSPIYSDPVFHTSRAQHSRPSGQQYPPRLNNIQATPWREGEAGPTSVLSSRNDTLFQSPSRHPWRKPNDVDSNSLMSSRDDPLWNQTRSSTFRTDTSPQPSWSSRQRDLSLWPESDSPAAAANPPQTGNWSSAFAHFGSGVSAPVGGARGSFSADTDKRYPEQEDYNMTLFTPTQSLSGRSAFQSNASGPFFSSQFSSSGPSNSGAQGQQHPMHYSYPSSQLDTFLLPLPGMASSESNNPREVSPSFSPGSRFGALSGYQEDAGSVTDTPSQKGKKHRNSIEDNPRRPKTSVACDFCRGRKLRCDGDKPCSNCKGRGYQCVYVHFQRRRGPGKNPKGPRAKKRAAQGAAAGGSQRSESAPLLTTQVDAGASMFSTLMVHSRNDPNPGASHTFQASPPELQDFGFRLPSEAPRYPSPSLPSGGLTRRRTPRSRERDRPDAEAIYRKMG